MFGNRRKARSQTKQLLRNQERRAVWKPGVKSEPLERLSGMRLRINYAGMKIPPLALYAAATGSAALCAFALGSVLSAKLLPIFIFIGAALPFAWLEKKITARSTAFSADYPAVLMAAASSIKAGMTPQLALVRATKLLPNGSLVREEVQQLSQRLERGEARQPSISKFGESVRQPDLELFRSAYELALENGGRFAPTLERLALVSKSRAALIGSARVSTATMRTTANILLAIAPILVLTVSKRTENYWELFHSHPTASVVASSGIALIVGSYMVLRHLSNFKP